MFIKKCKYCRQRTGYGPFMALCLGCGRGFNLCSLDHWYLFTSCSIECQGKHRKKLRTLMRSPLTGSWKQELQPAEVE